MSRMTEPSTYAGIAAISQALEVFFPQYGGIFNALTVVAGALAVALKERK